MPERHHRGPCRPPEICHKGRHIWQMEHDSQPGILLSYWYTEDGPHSQDGFDVRALPGFTEHPGSRGFANAMAWVASVDAHHATIIRKAIDNGVDLQATSDEYVGRQQEETARRDRERLAALAKHPQPV